MEQATFGRTGLKVSRLTFGCGAVGGLMTKGDAADQDYAVAWAGITASTSSTPPRAMVMAHRRVLWTGACREYRWHHCEYQGRATGRRTR